MARVVIELTNRCNLSCHHCFSGRHGGQDDLPLTILDRVLAEARLVGFDEISFTGGDPTVHPQFAEVIRRTAGAGYQFGLVTNGWNFAWKYPDVLRHRARLRIVTFSVDGATQSTHDALRGSGSFRRVLQAISICVVKQIPFTINMVVTARNRHEVARMTELAAKLGSRGLRYGHLMPAPLTTAQGCDLTPNERREVELEIRELQRQSTLPIAMAPGYHTASLFPCGPLQIQELNIDCRGNLTKCCHLSGHGPRSGQDDVIGNLAHLTFTEAYQQLTSENERFRAAKEARFAAGRLQDTDFFPCWYCSIHYGKVDWLRHVAHNAWPVPPLRPDGGPESRVGIDGADSAIRE
jgi:MoaA/NifB/PqqE/SkfB family radical SAM enzyme